MLGICSFIIEINNNNWRFGYKNRTKTGNQLMQFRMSNASISFHNCENITVIPIEPCHRSSSYKIRFYWRFGNLAMDNFICLNLVDDIIFLFKRLQFLSLLCKNLQWLQFRIFSLQKDVLVFCKIINPWTAYWASFAETDRCTRLCSTSRGELHDGET